MSMFPVELQGQFREFVDDWAPPDRHDEFVRSLMGLVFAFSVATIDWTKEELTAQILATGGSGPTPAEPVQAVDDD